MISVLQVGVGALLLVAGSTMVIRGVASRGKVRHELSDQKIMFPDVNGLPVDLGQYAGVQVRTGEQARAFADLIAANLAKMTAGRTYAEIVEQWHACGESDEHLAQLRHAAFMGQSLRGSLLGAYQAWQLTTLVSGLGGLLASVGLVFLAMAAS